MDDGRSGFGTILQTGYDCSYETKMPRVISSKLHARMKMDFNKLMADNHDAERRRHDRIESEVADLKERARSFLDSIDKGMLIAISKFGNLGFRFKTEEWQKKAYLWTDDVNSMMIIASGLMDVEDGVPDRFYVLGGDYGIRRSSGGVIDFVKVGCVPEDKFTLDDVMISPDVWSENKCDQRKFSIPMTGFIGIGGIKYLNNRSCSYPNEDKRNWFERAEDGLPKFTASFAEYLEERARCIK